MKFITDLSLTSWRRGATAGAGPDPDPGPPPAAAPAAFTAEQWSVTNDGTVRVEITALPADGGSAITALQYRVGTGAAVSMDGTATGTYTISASAADAVQIRAVNAVGAGAWSDSKSVPAAVVLLPALDCNVRLELREAGGLWADTATTTLASVDGAIARIDDASGYGNNATNATATQRPTRRLSGGLNHGGFDGVDDRLIIAPNASWNKTGQSLVVVLKAPLATVHLTLLGNAGTSETAIIGYMSLTASPTAASNTSGMGTGNFYANGALVGANITRQAAHGAYVTGNWIIAEIASVNLSGTVMVAQGAQFPGWRSRTTELGPVDIGAVIVLPTATLNTGTNRADLVAALAEQFGITI